MKKGIVACVRQNVPLVHNITNYVTVNDVANILLACGGSPIMADDEDEVEDITTICAALNINIGTLNQRTIRSMKKAGKRANALGHITILDPVGAGASTLRTTTAKSLLDQVKFTVIRGNVSELKALYGRTANTKGVDADVADSVTEENIDEMAAFAKDFSRKTGAIIAMTGAIDVVADANTAYIIRNGKPIMSKITGTGCMLSGVVAAYCAANADAPLDAAAAAVAAMGLCGEIAFERLQGQDGTSSFRTYLIDAMSNLTDEILEEGMKIEVR